MKKSLIEFRKDIVSGDWVLISSKDQKKPTFFNSRVSKPLPKALCPFERSPGLPREEETLFWLSRKGKNEFKDWLVRVFMNKYPVIMNYRACSPVFKEGLFEHTPGNGFQELVVMRDHFKPFGLMSKDEIRIVLESYVIRYHALRSEPCVEYIIILHNSGPRAGASVPHPHSQIFAIPIIPPDISRSLAGSKKYFKQHHKCVHCDMIRWEIKKKDRIIFQNKLFVVIAPYASKVAYEIRIFPKKHGARFEEIDDAQKSELASTMQIILSRIYKRMKNPDYNFFIHTAPPKDAKSTNYHWHIEIVPRIAIWGGLELGSGIEVVKVSPEEAAKVLR